MRRKARTPAVHAPTPMTNARSRTRSRRSKVGLASARSPSKGASIPVVTAASLAQGDADLRIPLSERASVRALPADGRPAGDGLRDLRRGPGRESAPSGARLLPRLGLLLDRVRARRAAEGRGPRRPPRAGRW